MVVIRARTRHDDFHPLWVGADLRKRPQATFSSDAPLLPFRAAPRRLSGDREEPGARAVNAAATGDPGNDLGAWSGNGFRRALCGGLPR